MGPTSQPDTAGRAERAKALREHGLSYNAIAIKLGVCWNTAQRLVTTDEPPKERQPQGLVTCNAGHWQGLVTVAGLVDRRVPLRIGEDARHCPDYEPVAVLRPEVLARRQRDAERSAAKRRAMREAAA